MDTEGLDQQEVQTSEVNQQDAAPSADTSSSLQQGDAAQTQAQQIAELEALDRFKFNGREMTAKELNRMVMAQSDYTQKSQAMAQERKFHAALPDDVKALKANPGLAEKFKQVYPPQFHYILDALGITPKQDASAQVPGKAGLPPEIQEVVSRLDRIEGSFKEKQTEAILAELTNIYEPLAKKYPLASEDEVDGAATALLDKLQKEHGDEASLTKAHFESLFKQSHEKHSKRFEQHYSERVKTQKQANARGRDVGPGGGTPGQAPVRPKSIKEATALAMQQINELS